MISEILRNRCMNSKCSNLQMPLDGTKREETVARVQRIKWLWVVSYTEKLCIVVILFFLVANEVYCLLIQTVLTYSVLKSPLLLCFLCGYVLKYNLLLWSKLNCHHHFSSVSHDPSEIKYTDLMLKKHVWLISMSKTVLLNICGNCNTFYF